MNDDYPPQRPHTRSNTRANKDSGSDTNSNNDNDTTHYKRQRQQIVMQQQQQHRQQAFQQQLYQPPIQEPHHEHDDVTFMSQLFDFPASTHATPYHPQQQQQQQQSPYLFSSSSAQQPVNPFYASAPAQQYTSSSPLLPSSVATNTTTSNTGTTFIPGTRSSHKRRATTHSAAPTSSSQQDSDSRIEWADLNVDAETERLMLTMLPSKEELTDFINEGNAPLQLRSRNVDLSQLSAEQKSALRVVKQRTRAENKSRREKQRRRMVNESLQVLATRLEMDAEVGKDMNSILTKAVECITQLQQTVDEQGKIIASLQQQLSTNNKNN